LCYTDDDDDADNNNNNNKFTGFWWRNLRERVHGEDPCVDGKIIIR
jgi:hypothetical protein